MDRRALVLLGVVVVSLTAGACGSKAAASATPQPVVTVTVTAGTPTPPPASSTGTMPKVTLGDKLTLTGLDNAKVEVTAKKTQRLPPKSISGIVLHLALFGVFIAVKNVADTPYVDSMGSALTLVDESGGTYQSNTTYGNIPGQLGVAEVRIAPGDTRSGWVYFEVPQKRHPRLLQYTADSYNTDNTTQVGEWSLR
jgi:hypothetical protein